MTSEVFRVMQLRIARWLIEYDPEATRRCFAQIPVGTGCECAQCRNFDLAVNRAFPEQFVALAEDLGVDIAKPAELCHYCREASGLYLTGGWFHFAGSILDGEDVLQWSGSGGTYRFEELVPGLEFGFGARLALVPQVFQSAAVIQLEFQTRVPWVLTEPEPG